MVAEICDRLVETTFGSMATEEAVCGLEAGVAELQRQSLDRQSQASDAICEAERQSMRDQEGGREVDHQERKRKVDDYGSVHDHPMKRR